MLISILVVALPVVLPLKTKQKKNKKKNRKNEESNEILAWKLWHLTVTSWQIFVSSISGHCFLASKLWTALLLIFFSGVMYVSSLVFVVVGVSCAGQGALSCVVCVLGGAHTTLLPWDISWSCDSVGADWAPLSVFLCTIVSWVNSDLRIQLGILSITVRKTIPAPPSWGFLVFLCKNNLMVILFCAGWHRRWFSGGKCGVQHHAGHQCLRAVCWLGRWQFLFHWCAWQHCSHFIPLVLCVHCPDRWTCTCLHCSEKSWLFLPCPVEAEAKCFQHAAVFTAKKRMDPISFSGCFMSEPEMAKIAQALSKLLVALLLEFAGIHPHCGD